MVTFEVMMKLVKSHSLRRTWYATKKVHEICNFRKRHKTCQFLSVRKINF